MAVTHSFRSALRGFNREDVVHYIEFLNTKHTAQVNQLTAEAEDLRKELKALKDVPVDTEEKDALVAQCADLQKENADQAAKLVQMQEEIDRLNALIAEREQNLATKELEAYRRAEQAERVARERADLIYQQATGTLAQATSQVDQAAAAFRQIADQVSGQMSQLQLAVDTSRNALLDAATTMYAIRPETQE